MRAGYYKREINAMHPCRDGNGRAQLESIRGLSIQAGFTVDWSRVTRVRILAVSLDSFKTGDNSGLAAWILFSVSLPRMY